jgi:transcriptional regulator with XRE-family HTH domain
MDYENYKKQVGTRIKGLREKNRESQIKLGEAIGLTQNSISKIENGDVELRLEHQLRIAEHYHVSHDYICTGADNNTLLDTLNKYIRLGYHSTQIGDLEHYTIPKIEINKTFFNYLKQSARAHKDGYIPEEIKRDWLNKEIQNFYDFIDNSTANEYVSFIPLPDNLLWPDDKKSEWNQKDLLRETNTYYNL